MSNHTAMRHQTGFTLISVMIVVVIIGILAAIAYPSYIDQVRASRRTGARASLMQIAAREERFYTEHNSYGDLEALGYTSPLYSDNEWYQLAAEYLHNSAAASQGGGSATLPSLDAINSGTVAHSYVLTAIPRNAQTHDDCGGLTLDSLGRKDITNPTNTSMGAEDCW